MESRCRFCFNRFVRIEKHEAKCEIEPSKQDLGRIVRDLLDRVDTQDRTIQELKRCRTEPMSQIPVSLPILNELDLKAFLTSGIDIMVREHEWPVRVYKKVTYVCENGIWLKATDVQLKMQTAVILSQLATLFQVYVIRKGWLDDDPKGKYPENSLKVYGINPSTVQKSILKHVKSELKF